MKKTMGGLDQIGTCAINILGRLRKGWPVFARTGVWVLTPPPLWGSNKPGLTWEWMAVTHEPTGLRAGYVRADDPRKLRTLAKYARWFGKATTTQEGVTRKYRKLSKRQQQWIKNQVPYFLLAKKAGTH